MEFRTLTRRTFGPFRRYCLEVARDRFGATVYIVTDAERLDPLTGLPDVIRQEYSEAAALANLPL